MNSNTKLCNFAKNLATFATIIYDIVILVKAIKSATAYGFIPFVGECISMCGIPMIISVVGILSFYIVCNFFCDIETIAYNTKRRTEFEIYTHHKNND